MFGCFHNAAFVRIHKAYPLQGRRVMSSVWGAGQMAWTKMVFVFDANAPIHDEDAHRLPFDRRASGARVRSAADDARKAADSDRREVRQA